MEENNNTIVEEVGKEVPPGSGSPEREGKGRRERTFSEEFERQRLWVSRLITIVMVLLTTFPLFIIFQKMMRHLGILPVNTPWLLHLESIVVVAGMIAGLYVLYRKIRSTMISLLALVIAGLITTSVIGVYTFSDLAQDYRDITAKLANPDNSVSDVLTNKFPKEKQFAEACRITPKIKQYANKAAQANFKKQQSGSYRIYVQCFSVFKEINSRWNYVSDPNKWDYIAPAEETLESFAGDCDDYAVLMAACINSVGGVVRLVRTPDHVYPELKISSMEDFNAISKMIRTELFPPKTTTRRQGRKIIKTTTGRISNINYHQDSKGNIWLNLDYTAPHPGGRFMSSEVVAVMTVR